MNKITIESIDQVMERVPGISYAKAKEAILQCDGDVVDAIILLQQSHKEENKQEDNKKSFEEVFGKDSDKIKAQLLDLFKKGNAIRIVVERNGKVIINVPITVGGVGIVFAPVLSLVGLSISLLSKCKIKIENEDEGTTVDLGEFSEDKLIIIKDMIGSVTKDVKDAVEKRNKNVEYRNTEDKSEVIIDLNRNDYREKQDEE